MENSKIDITQKSMSPFQWLMVIICFILNFNDGIDVLLVSFSSADIIKQWGLSKTEMGYIFSAGLAGMTLGCLFIAPMADKIGRRTIFLYSVAMITLGMFGVGFGNSYALMLVFRFITGLGIGGLLPTMAATASEFSNQKHRDFNVSVVQAGWPIGAIITGLFCAKYIPIYGWQSAFVVAGFISLFMFVLVYFFMTDSIDFILQNPKPNSLEKLNDLLVKMKLEALSKLPETSNRTEKAGISSLFTPQYKSNTLRIWVAAFFGFMTLYTLMSWVPNIAKESGLSFELATWVGITLNFGAAFGSAAIGAIGGKFGLQKTILTFMFIAFCVMQIYAFANLTTILIFVLVLLIGFFVQGGFNGIWPTLSRLYETKIRATGVGYTAGVGRFGAILGPLLFGYFSENGFGIKALFIAFSLPLLIMGFCIYSLKSNKLKS